LDSNVNIDRNLKEQEKCLQKAVQKATRAVQGREKFRQDVSLVLANLLGVGATGLLTADAGVACECRLGGGVVWVGIRHCDGDYRK
jgi:hypothetical protein